MYSSLLRISGQIHHWKHLPFMLHFIELRRKTSLTLWIEVDDSEAAKMTNHLYGIQLSSVYTSGVDQLNGVERLYRSNSSHRGSW